MKFARIESNKISGMMAGKSKLSPVYYRELDQDANITKEEKALLHFLDLDEKEIKAIMKSGKIPTAGKYPVKLIEKKKEPVGKVDLLKKNGVKEK